MLCHVALGDRQTDRQMRTLQDIVQALGGRGVSAARKAVQIGLQDTGAAEQPDLDLGHSNPFSPCQSHTLLN
jgi:hypothetical protein